MNPAWDKSRDHFWEYQARCAQLLQTGKPIIDILVFLGEDLPAKTMAFKLPEIPEGYSFDVCTPASLRYWIQNKDTMAPDYKILVVQDRSIISEESELLFDRLEKQGIKIIRCDKGETVDESLDRYGIGPDIRIKSEDRPDSKLHFCHRQNDDTDIYFIYNHSASEYLGDLSIRSGKTDIEIWNPLTSERSIAVTDTLSLKPYEAVFIIAR